MCPPPVRKAVKAAADPDLKRVEKVKAVKALELKNLFGGIFTIALIFAFVSLSALLVGASLAYNEELNSALVPKVSPGNCPNYVC